jgi:glycosyltransferase involved in cell wall biosynthesis
MAACWQALVRTGQYEVKVLAFQTAGDKAAPFDPSIMSGVPCVLLDEKQRQDAALIRKHVVEFKPDAIVISGWFHKPYRRLASDPALKGCRFIMGMDNPWLGTWRQHLSRWVDRRYRSRMDAVAVPGERGYQFARRLGFDDTQIYRGLYGVESAAFTGLIEKREAFPGGWSRRFVFVGRYADVKGLDTLVEGYRQYRAGVSDPWPLTTCGTGPLASLLKGVEGIDDRGFTQPAALPGVLGEAGCFVLASRFDPWPLVVVEACMAGLPVVCSTACGSAVELLRPMHNGLIFCTGNASHLAHQLRWMHDHHDQLPEMGRRSAEAGSAYSPAMWVRRWAKIIEG